MEPIITYSTPVIYNRKRTYGTAIGTTSGGRTLKRVRITSRRTLAPLRTGGYRGYGGGLRRYTFRKLRSIVKNWQPPEQKYVDVNANATGASNAGNIVLLNGIANGNGVSERIGRKVTMTSSYIKMTFDISGAGVNTMTWRVMLVYDAQPNQLAFTLANLLQSGAAVTNTISALNLDNRDRFNVLLDKTFTAVKGTDTGKAICKLYKKMKLNTIYDATGGTIADITTGALCLVVIAESTDAAAQYNYYVRTRYVDV